MVERVLLIVQLLLLTAAVMLGVEAWDAWQSPPRSVEPSSGRGAQGARPAAAVTPAYAHYGAISRRDLFRTGPEPTAAPVVDVKALEPTQLKLTLWGTIAGEDGTDYAIIESPRRKTQQLYRAGDSIETAQLKRILRGKVVLTVGGKDEVLRMAAQSSRAATAGGRTAAGGASRRPIAPPPPPVPASPEGELPEAEPPPETKTDDTIVLTGEMLAPVAELLATEAEALFAPVEDDPTGEGGLRVTAGKRAAVLRQLGIRNGDVITAVDDTPTVEASDVATAFQEIPAGGEVALTVRRGDNIETLRYRMPQ